MRNTVFVVVGMFLTLALTWYAFAAPDAAPTTKVVKKVEPTTSEPVEPPEAPKNAGEAVDATKQLIEQGKAKQWFAMSAGVIWVLMFVFKVVRKKFFPGMPKRVLWIVVPALSVAAMLLAKLQADLSWGAAFTVLASGPSVAFLNDMVKRGILGKEPTQTVNSKG